MQYCRATSIPKKVVYSPYLQQKCMRYKLSCSGIKHCQYLPSRYLERTYTDFSGEILSQLRRENGLLSQSDHSAAKRYAAR